MSVVNKLNMNEYSMDEIKKHNNDENGYWILMDGLIYDVSKFSKHPGQFDILKKYSGTDATKKFNEIHSENAREMRKKFLIGKLKKNESDDNYEVENVLPESDVPGYYYLLPVLVVIILIFISLKNNNVI